MKPMFFYSALAFAALALPSAAQTGEAQNNISPQILQALRTLHRGSAHLSITPEEKAYSQAILERVGDMNRAGADAIHSKDFVAAESCFRESIKGCPSYVSYYGLAEALTGQGRVAEAIEAYRAGISSEGDNKMPDVAPDPHDGAQKQRFNPNGCIWHGQADTEAWIKYALLLSQTGQSAEAVIMYKKALPDVPNANDQTIDPLPDAATLSPTAFQATGHIALGLCAAFCTGHDKAMQEFDKARQLQPDAPLTNYYYGYGWQELSPAERAQFGSAAQAKAALQKAARLGKGAVKKAATKALQVAMKP